MGLGCVRLWTRVCVAAGNLPGLEYSAVPMKLTATVPVNLWKQVH